MKPLSQSEYRELRDLYESVYTPKVDLTEELLDEISDELIEELIEEGYSEEEAIEIVDEATDLYIDETLCEVSDSYYDSAVRASKKAAQGIDKAARQKRRAGQVRYAKRKAGDALKGAVGAAKGTLSKVKSKAAGAAVDVAMAGSMAKKKVGEVKQAAKEAPGKAKAAASDAKKKAKSGIKGFIKRQAEKVVKRMSEENVEELYKGRHGQSDKEYADSRSQGGKMVSGDSKQSGAEYTHGRRVKAANPGMQPDVGGKTKPKSQGKMDRGTRADLEYRKANLKKEEFDAFDVVLEFLQVEGYAETLEEAEWMMANLIDEEAIDIIKAEPIKGGVVEEGKALGTANKKGSDTNPKGTDLRSSSGRGMTFTKAAGLGKKKTFKNNPDGDDMVKSMYDKHVQDEKRGESREDRLKRVRQNKARKSSNIMKIVKKEEFEAWLDEAMSSYDRNRKRAAQRAAARNAARDAGKTGVVPGVGYVSPRRERETYTDEKGTVRHKSGAKMPKD